MVCKVFSIVRPGNAGVAWSREGSKMKTLLTAVVGLAVLSIATSLRAAEIKVLASNGVREALHELAAAFERDTGNKLVIGFGLAAALKRRIGAGEALDLAIPPPPRAGTT